MTCHSDERRNAIPSKRTAPARTSAPDRLDTTLIGHDERRLEGCPSDSPTEGTSGTLLKRPGEYGSSLTISQGIESDDTLAKPVYRLRANTSRCTQITVSERALDEEGGSANRLRRRARATPCESEVFEGSNVDGRDGNATNLRGNLVRGCSPTRSRRIPEVTRVASAQDLDTARSASHCKDGTNTNAAVRKRRAKVMQGIIRARLERKDQLEGNFEGEQGPGRVGQRTSS